MLTRIRFFILRLVVGKTPVIANVNFPSGLNIGKTDGAYMWNNVIENIRVDSADEFTRAG